MPTIPVSQIIFFIASCITIVALYSSDMLILQSLYLISSLLFLISSIYFKIAIMIFFNICYVFVNLLQIIKILLARSTLLLPDDLKKLYLHSFSMMTPREFMLFFKTGTKQIINTGEYLCREGDTNKHLTLLLQGTLIVEKNGQLIANLDQFNYIGEMHYLTHKPMTADVKAKNKITCITWHFDTLKQLKSKNPHTYTRFLETIANDLVAKISHQQIILQ